jgi:hypothetical protein
VGNFTVRKLARRAEISGEVHRVQIFPQCRNYAYTGAQ